MDIRLDSTGLRVVPLRGRADERPAAARTAREAGEADVAHDAARITDMCDAHDLVRVVADAVRGRPQVAGMLHGTQDAAVLSLLA